MPEAWLSGPVEGVPPPLMPAAHALLDAVREIEEAVGDLSTEALWLRPGGAASIGFHLEHIVGSSDRLLTYARGEPLTSEQRAAISEEGKPGDPPADADTLLEALHRSVEATLDVYRATPAERLTEPREVGRARLPSTVLGLLFHAAEHARRHSGQVVTTARIIRGLGMGQTPGPD